MKTILLILLTLLTLNGCQSNTNTESKIKEAKNTIRKETKFFGDTLKIEYEYRGDTIFQNRIDLKGRSDDNFDNSFTVMSILSTKNTTELNCKNKLTLTHDGVDFTFCIEDAINKIELDIEESSDKPWRLEKLNKTKKELILIQNGKIDSLSERTFSLTFDLLRNIDFSIYDNDQKVNVKKVGIEQYETSFSGGRNFYLIDKKNDTIARFYVNEWMK